MNPSSVVALTLVCSLLITISTSAQTKIEVGENIHLDFGNRQRAAAECMLAVNPSNANHLLAVAISADPNSNNDYSTIALVSFDGGKQWKASTMPTKHAADPWGIILPDGTFVRPFGKTPRPVFCLNAATGKVVWLTEGRAGNNATLVQTKGLLFLLTDEAKLIVVRKGPRSFEPLKTYAVADNLIMTYPVVNRRQILIKETEGLALWSLE